MNTAPRTTITFCFMLLGMFFVFVPLLVASVDPDKPPFVHGVRPLGMGDAFTAVADDFNLLFYNPAGLAVLEKGQTYLLHLGAKVDHQSYGDINYIIDMSDADMLEPENITQDTINRIVRSRVSVGAEILRGGYIRKNIGMGAYMPVDVHIEFSPGLLIPNAEVLVRYDIITSYSGAYGLKLSNGTLCFGGSLRTIRRTRFQKEQNVLEFANDFSDTDDMMAYFRENTRTYWGVSTDFGMLWQKSEKTSFAFVANDLMCRMLGDWKRPNLKLGYAHRFDLGTGWMWEGLLLAVDWVNIIGDEERVPLWRKKFSMRSLEDSLPIFAKRLRIGIESTFMKFSRVRLGLHQGYPTFGYGIDAAFFHVNYALYGREFGVFPGDDGRYFHQVEMSIAF